MARKPATSWGGHSRQWRDRVARQYERLGLSRRSVREMYNRGTVKPFARTAEGRLPEKIRLQRRRAGAEEASRVPADLIERVINKLVKHTSGRMTQDSRDGLRVHLQTLKLADIHRVLKMTEAQMKNLARFNKSGQNKLVDSLNPLADSGGFYNIFWYRLRR